MLYFKRLHITFAFIGLVTLTSYTYSNDKTPSQDTLSTYQALLTESIKQIQSDPEKVLTDLKRIYAISLSEKDTSSALTCLIGIGDIYRFWGNYEESFDHLWDALLLANESQDSVNQVQINRNIGILYDIYNKDDLALEHLHRALALSKILNKQKKLKAYKVVDCLFSLSTFYRDKANYPMAHSYLDSCANSYMPKQEKPYVDAERGFLYMKEGRYKESQQKLRKALALMEARGDRYTAVVLSYYGDLKMEEGQKDSALFYYKKSLSVLEFHNSYQEVKPELLQKLADLHQQKGSHALAYNYLLAAKNASDSLFNSTNRRNNQLFEIRNKYKETVEAQASLIAQQSSQLQFRDKVQLWLKIIVLILVIVGVATYMIIRLRNRIKELAFTQQLEREKNEEILELKSKELASYALQMIEKEKSVNELLEIIKKESKSSHNQLKSKHTKAQENLWNDFNLRFTEVNGGFYENLREKHPELSFTEQKHCALIKLNFDSNEMAQILNISLQSVHTSRYRIRKKMKLEHGESLSDYVGRL